VTGAGVRRASVVEGRPTEARVVAQAKVNLMLRVLAREASGYHQIETLFLRLALADDVVVRIAPGCQTLDCSGADVGPTDRNLAYRAAIAYVEARGWPTGFEIEIDKHIPVGGGLGGGSADAAAVLRALAALDPDPIPPDALIALAGRLGADVPFLTADCGLALAWGRGDRLLALPAPPSRPVLLYLPPFGVPTAAAYGWVAEAHAGRTAPARLLPPHALTDWDWLTVSGGNDFEEPVGARHPEIHVALSALRSLDGVVLARMTGSGSTVFGILDATADANAMASRLRALLPGTVVVTSTASAAAPVALR
jgi:4-diphosphocytidyl-2-C-methyl-D-erythritol kinase